MEYSPMMVVMLWALTPSDCFPTAGGGPGEPARVVELPQPIMSVHPEGGYFTFNHGRPFLGERDPLTGAIDSNIKTTPVSTDDYLYEEYEESGESIDRKDTSKIYTRNDISSSSKDSDLHKFLNLPVHYSSSGKFPLISSSYANTKVQGHGPLSNHKLYSSTTSTTTTVSPSYYPLKTTVASTTPSVVITTTSATTTSSTTTTTTTPQPTLSTTVPTISTTIKPLVTITTTKALPQTIKTTTSKLPLPVYEYEYDYDYDKSEGEATEKASQDYEFLGASSEVTKSYDKSSSTAFIDKSSSLHIFPGASTTKSQTIESTSTIPLSTTVGKISTAMPKQTTSAVHVLNLEVKPTATAEITKEEILKETNLNNLSATLNQEDTFDLRPPTPELPVELRPPQVLPTRLYSSVVPTKQSFVQTGFVRYPEPQLVADKKPIHLYSPINNSNSKPEVPPTKLQHTKLGFTPEQGNQNSSSKIKSQDTLSQKNPSDKRNTETHSATNSYDEIESGFEKSTKPSLQDKNYSITQERPSGILIIDKNRPLSPPSPSYSVSSGIPFDKNKSPQENEGKLTGNPHPEKRPQNVLGLEHSMLEDLLPEHNQHHIIQTKAEFMKPQVLASSENSKLQGSPTIGSTRPPQEQRPHIAVQQGHAKPLVLYENSKPVGVPTSEIRRPPRPQGALPEKSRLPINPKPDNNRPQSSNLPSNNKPHVHYTIDHRPQNFPPMYDPSRPQNYSPYGLRINERPYGSENGRPQVTDHLRPHNVKIPERKPQVSHEPVKPVIEIDGRPLQGIAGDLRPEANSKPLIFSKPQSGKKPDYNAVQFGQPSKVENHFISVPPGHDNPSYSLQTSFSIGVPPPEQKQTPGGAHGVGQVLFPDDEPEKVLPVWAHQRPPQITPSDSLLEKYPRPPWESHLKPPHIYHKKEPYTPIKRKPLPNILPQFRPNAKIGHVEPHIYLKPREPYDTLQPPPLPRPQFLRLEQDTEETKPLVHRRNGQGSTRVTTLQMMQGPPPSKRASLRIDDSNEKNEPVFVVYPSNGASLSPSSSPPSEGVVVGTRGPQRPLPPDNLDIGDDLDSFSLDNNKNFQARVDTPVLKSKSTSKPIIKNDFPYALIKPHAEERNTPDNVVTKEYTAFSPTVPSAEKDHDTEINIIPYLQDYMPFATKKPPHKETWILGTDMKTLSSSLGIKKNVADIAHKNENHRVVVVNEGPQPQDFQAPFHASLTAPSQGWSVVQKKMNKDKIHEEVTTIKELSDVQTTQEPKFDIQNFKPQLFGGFKPIVSPIDNESNEKLQL